MIRWDGEVTDRYSLTDRLNAVLGALPGRLVSGAAGSLQHALGVGASLLTVLVLTIYIMVGLPRLRREMVQLFPPSRRPQIADALDVVVDKVGGYMIGNIIVTVFATEVWPTGVIVLIFFILYQQMENYLISPRVIRNAVDLPAMAVLLSALIGGALLGLVGTIMAIPIAATVKVLLSRTSLWERGSHTRAQG